MNGKLISAGAGLFGLGAVMSWAFTADYFENKSREKIEARDYIINFLRNENYVLRSENDDLMMTIMKLDPEKTPEGTTAETDVTDEAEEVDEEKLEEQRTNLQRIIDDYSTSPEANREFAEQAVEFDNDVTPPFVIPQSKYAWDEDEGDNYAKITVTYYPTPRVVVDDGEEPMQDIANTLGWKNLNRFGDESNDADVVFIRNRRLRTDFEVVRETEAELPLHIKYGFGKEEFQTNLAAGLIKLRPEDRA